jgi:hypothetical protein
MAYIAKLQKGQSLSQEAAFSAVTQPKKLKDNPNYEWIYDGQKLGKEHFPMWRDSHKTVVYRVSHHPDVMSGYVATLESAISPKDLRRLYGPGVYNVHIRGPYTTKDGVKKRFAFLASFIVIISEEEPMNCSNCAYRRPTNPPHCNIKALATEDTGYCDKWKKRKPLIAGAGLAGDIGLDNVSPVFNNYDLGENKGSLSAEMAEAAKKPKAAPAFESNADLKLFLDGVKTQDVGAPPPEKAAPKPTPKEPLPDQYDFIRALSRKTDTESED